VPARISFKVVGKHGDEHVQQHHAARAWLADVAAADFRRQAIGNNGGEFILRPLPANPLNCFDTIEHLSFPDSPGRNQLPIGKFMEQRTYKRKPVLWSARLHRDGRVLECAVLHISAGGARIRVRERFRIDSTVVLVIDRLGAFPGEIRWQKGNCAGIRFLEDEIQVPGTLREEGARQDAALGQPVGRDQADATGAGDRQRRPRATAIVAPPRVL
jgi:PilZ domain